MSSDEVYVDCSDDEKYDVKLVDDKWLPPPEEIVRLYEAIDEHGCLELEWQCPGRRPPTPTETAHSNPSSNENVDEEPINNSDFDFQEEMNHLNLRPTGDNQLKGSAKKKTTTFDAILSNMARHRKLDNMANEGGNGS
ncbi:PAXIP1-associated glutamate-rich protein 1 [Planococcus citri]|uniref:PAXIP1-associated glutamate-rich protein 1 n=1 Tax=Planococcus citri TaxID=170843 RepID=UPI0031F74E3C